MHDLRFIRENPEAFDAALARRGMEPQSAALLALDKEQRALTTQLQAAQSRRNDASKAIGEVMAKQAATDFAVLILGEDHRTYSHIAIRDILMAEVAGLKSEMVDLGERVGLLKEQLDNVLATLPNLPADDVPEGADEEGNVEVSRWGTPRSFAFTPKEHADFGPMLGMEFETAAKMSGARFTFLRGGMARLHRALAQFMLDYQAGERGYTECNPPVLVRDEALFGTGQLPKFAEDQFQTYRIPPKFPLKSVNNGTVQMDFSNVGTDYVVSMDAFFEHNNFSDPDNIPSVWKVESQYLRAVIPGHYLIPTAEVSLTNSVREQIIDDLAQPIRLTALTPCFRSEAGAAGKDTRGFIRQHQFEKVELVSICRPEDSEAEHAHMLESAEGVLKALDLPYRKMLLCSGDMGFTAKKTFDLEVWLPGQNAYREISSVSWCGDFQARRMNTRYRVAGEKKTEFVHTLNGSGIISRRMVRFSCPTHCADIWAGSPSWRFPMHNAPLLLPLEGETGWGWSALACVDNLLPHGEGSWS
jgi:seryl-tRNA synthetase